jgi:hypothetical protein
MLSFAICSSPPVRSKEHGDETFVKYQCMFDRTKADAGMRSTFRKHFEGTNRIIMQNPVLRIPGGAITKHSVHVPDNADITIHAETSPRADWSEVAQRILTVRVIANGNAQPRRTKPSFRAVYGVGPCPGATRLTQFKKCSFGAQDIQANVRVMGVQVVDVNADINIASCNILGDCQDRL